MKTDPKVLDKLERLEPSDRTYRRSSELRHEVILSLVADARALATAEAKLAAVREKCEHYSTFPYDNAVKVTAKEILALITPE